MISVNKPAGAGSVSVAPPEGDRRVRAVERPERERKAELGQFLTPAPVAEFMAGLFESAPQAIDLLDAGAGAGALAAALVRRLCLGKVKPERISVTAYEVDGRLIMPLRATLSRCQEACEREGIAFSAEARNEDFVAAVVPPLRGDLFAPRARRFNTAIVNPPYRKIRSDSPERLLLRSVGIETSNLYTGFVALITRLLDQGGELVAITPRSFCNGPYFKPFRTDFLRRMSLRRLHVFESRAAAFSAEDVLQENLIVHAVKEATRPTRVIVSQSSGVPGSRVAERRVAFADVVSPADPEQFIHLAVDATHDEAKVAMSRFCATLAELGVSVSTGRVVDFRAKPYLRQEQGQGTAPLIYPCHCNRGLVQWPKDDSRKPNAIVSNSQTQELLVPAGFYVLVKRFTAKEERRRVVASIYDPGRVQQPLVGFENHLNYFHANGAGLPMILAKGLAAFLNSTVVDLCFRQFSGHTQVNATDLRSLRFPARRALERLGRRVEDPGMPQEQLDRLVEEELL